MGPSSTYYGVASNSVAATCGSGNRDHDLLLATFLAMAALEAAEKSVDADKVTYIHCCERGSVRKQ